MFNIGPAEVMVILVVALLVLGPKRLPEAARQMGRAMSEFRRVTAGLQDEVRTVLDDHLEPIGPLEPTLLPPAVEATEGFPPVATGAAEPNGEARATPPESAAPPPAAPPA